jgi:aminoglycoside phosphotransferase family enzyme/predicted kinase
VIPDAQREVAALLGALTGAAPIETHVSLVFVGRADAFKLKKAVTRTFLDFAPLAAREFFCRRELALNQPHAPALYREVLPVTRAEDGSLRLGGDGPVLDWVLRMAPLPAEDFLNVRAVREGLSPALLDRLADAVAALHAAAPARQDVDSVARMRAVLAGNVDSCQAAGIDPWPATAALGALLERVAPAIAARAPVRVRRCHGDLHLGNLVLLEGVPTPFDALEFDEAMARTDTGYDIAFLLMDLDLLAGRAAANRVMNRYLARTRDDGLLAPLPFWLGLRAMVRAHIEAKRGGDGGRYLAAAIAYAAPVPPRLVAVGGLQGTGKSTLARALAPGLGVAPGALHLRSDEVRKHLAGLPPEARLPAEAYSPAASAAVHDRLFATAGTALAAGHSVVLDAMFLDPALRDAARAAAGPYPFTGLWLDAPLPLLEARVGARTGDASDADVGVLRRAAAADPGPIDWHRLDAAGDATAPARALLAPTIIS